MLMPGLVHPFVAMAALAGVAIGPGAVTLAPAEHALPPAVQAAAAATENAISEYRKPCVMGTPALCAEGKLAPGRPRDGVNRDAERIFVHKSESSRGPRRRPDSPYSRGAARTAAESAIVSRRKTFSPPGKPRARRKAVPRY